MNHQIKPYCPRPLIKVNQSQTVISRQIKIINRCFYKPEITVVLGHDFDSIVGRIPAGVRVVQNENYEETGILRSIAIGIRASTNASVLVVAGDLVFNESTLKNLDTTKSFLVVDNNKQMHNNEVGVTAIDGYATQLDYGLPTKWAQIMLLTGDELSMFKRIACSGRHNRWNAFEAINKTISMGGNFRVIEPKNMSIAEIDSTGDIEAARRITR